METIVWRRAEEPRPGAGEGARGQGLAAGSVRNTYEVAARVFDAAVEDRVIPFTPCCRIALPKGDMGEVVPPTLEQIHAVRGKLDERWRAIPLVLAASGPRIGELLGLGVYDVDYLRRTIRVERQRLKSGDLAPLKSKTSRRTVPVGQVALDAITSHLSACPGNKAALFVDEFGAPLTYRRWKGLCRDAAQAAEVTATSHDLRHFAASGPYLGRCVSEAGADVPRARVRGHHPADLRAHVPRR